MLNRQHLHDPENWQNTWFRVLAAFCLIIFSFTPMVRAGESSSLGPAPRSDGALKADVPNPFKLAVYLQGVGQYELCVMEALRVGYEQPSLEAAALQRAAFCLTAQGRLADGRKLLTKALSSNTADVVGGRVLLDYCLNVLVDPNHDGLALCTAKASSVRGLAEPVEAGGQLPRIQYVAALPEAFKAIPARDEPMRLIVPATSAVAHSMPLNPGIVTDPILIQWATEDLQLEAQSRALATRAPWKAGVLSALLPGAGRAYVGRSKDGLTSFLLVAIPAGLSTLGYSMRGYQSPMFWTGVSSAIMMYAGNIYGSVIGARMFNVDQQNMWRKRVRERWATRLKEVDQGDVANE